MKARNATPVIMETSYKCKDFQLLLVIGPKQESNFVQTQTKRVTTGQYRGRIFGQLANKGDGSPMVPHLKFSLLSILILGEGKTPSSSQPASMDPVVSETVFNQKLN